MWILWMVGICSVTVTAVLWVSGLGYMKENHPDYKGKDLFDEEEEKYVDEK